MMLASFCSPQTKGRTMRPSSRRCRCAASTGAWRLPEVRRAINLLARVGDGDLRALCQVHIGVAAFHDAPDEGEPHPRLDGRRRPAKLFDELLRPAELRGPARGL